MNNPFLSQTISLIIVVSIFSTNLFAQQKGQQASLVLTNGEQTIDLMQKENLPILFFAKGYIKEIETTKVKSYRLLIIAYKNGKQNIISTNTFEWVYKQAESICKIKPDSLIIYVHKDLKDYNCSVKVLY